MSSGPAAEWIAPAEAYAGEVRKLSTLLEARQALSATLDLKEALRRVLEILGRHHGAIRSTVVLLNEVTGDVEVEASAGAAAPDQQARHRPGEGIAGRVVQTGRPLVVPRVSDEPMFPHRASDRPEQELTHISAPIALDGPTVGAVGIDLRFKPDRDYNRTVKFLGVVGSIVAQAVKVHRLIEADRQRLVDENAHLRQELKERYDFSNLVGTSGPMRRVYEQVSQVARANTTVLLRGESGTGKELIAHALHYFIDKFAREHGRKVKRISTPAIDMLASYHWPGNVRELAKAIERAIVVSDGQVIHAHDLPPTLQTAEASGTVQTATLRESLEAFEKDALEDALKTARGNRARAARLLSTTERIFNYRVRKYRIDWRRFKT